MKKFLLTLNAVFLFLCVSMYFGTGWSLVLFSFPVASQLTVDTYYLEFVPPVDAATAFFTPMTKLMLLSCLVMIIAEWRTGRVWIPIIVLGAVIAATVLTEKSIFPLNIQMKAGIKDPVALREILDDWMHLNRIRVGVWSVEWAAMMAFFALPANRNPQRA